jgi:thiol-disulfide isomerase/thioredoxin
MVSNRNALLDSSIFKKMNLFPTVWQRFRRPFPKPAALAVLIAATVFPLLLSGCSGQKLLQIEDQDDFDRKISQSEIPVLVEFYKGGCPTCVALEPKLGKLAREYQDRVIFARFQLMTPFFVVKAPELKERYKVSYFPTAILFVDGQEKKRWVLDYNLDKYREVLDETVGPKQEEMTDTP